MPQFLVPIISAIGAAAGGVLGATMIMYAGVIATGLVLVGTLALSQYQKRKAERAARAQFDAAQVDRFTNMPLTVAPRELVFGRLRKGGTPFFRSSWGPFKDNFVMTIALASHEIDDIEEIYFNDQVVDVDGSGNVTTAPYARDFRRSGSESMFTTSVVLPHTPIAESIKVIRSLGVGTDSQTGNQEFTLSGNTITIDSYDPQWNYTVSYQWLETAYYARVFWHLGAPGQTADTRLQSYFPGQWTTDHRAEGVAYLLCEFVYDETAYPSGLPNVTALIRGAKCYDPRTTLTEFTENPAIMMRHVLLHPQFGKRTSITAAEDARITAAANACDTTISYTGSDLVQTFRAATVFPYGAAARDALDDLSQAMGGEWAYASGEFYVRAGVYQAPVKDLFDADLAVVQRDAGGSVSQSAISISPHRARNEKINTVVARIWDQAAGYVQTPITPMRVDAYVTADGAEISQEVTMPAVFYSYQAFHIAGIMLRDSRDPLTVVLPFKLTAYPVQMFDTITLTLARYGWVGKPFRVLGRTFMPGGYIVLTLKETQADIYQWGAGFQPGGYANNASGLPRPWDISPPAITSIVSGESELVVQSDGTVINGVRVIWPAMQDSAIAPGGWIDVEYMVAPDGEWRGMSVAGGDTQAVFLGIPDGSIIAVRARSRNAVAVSDWGVQQWHTVVGKTEPPPNIENLSIAGSIISWTLPSRVPDLAGFVFRFHYGNHLDWNSATPLHTGLVTESPFDLVTRPAGVVTIMGKAIDTSGNESAEAAVIVMNLGDVLLNNVVEQADYDLFGWPAADGSSGYTLIAGKPTANALDSFYGTDDQSFYRDDISSFYDASSYEQMVYVTPEIVLTGVLAGSVVALGVAAQGVDLKVEYRLVAPESFYGPDGASFYDADAEPFYSAPGPWMPWPGQIIAANDGYQFRVTLGAGPVQGILQQLIVYVDAPDINESIADLVIAAGGTPLPYVSNFTAIKTVQATLQANGSGAVYLHIDKTTPLAPLVRAFNSAGVAVSGATADVVIQGY